MWKGEKHEREVDTCFISIPPSSPLLDTSHFLASFSPPPSVASSGCVFHNAVCRISHRHSSVEKKSWKINTGRGVQDSVLNATVHQKANGKLILSPVIVFRSDDNDDDDNAQDAIQWLLWRSCSFSDCTASKSPNNYTPYNSLLIIRNIFANLVRIVYESFILQEYFCNNVKMMMHARARAHTVS